MEFRWLTKRAAFHKGAFAHVRKCCIPEGEMLAVFSLLSLPFGNCPCLMRTFPVKLSPALMKRRWSRNRTTGHLTAPCCTFKMAACLQNVLHQLLPRFILNCQKMTHSLNIIENLCGSTTIRM